MSDDTAATGPGEHLDHIIGQLEQGDHAALAERLEQAHPAEMAELIEALPSDLRTELWQAVPVAREGEVLSHLNDEARALIIGEMAPAELVAAAESLAPEDLADIVEELPNDIGQTLLDTMDQDHRARMEAVLTHAEGSAGRLMRTEALSVRADVSLAVVLRWLRRHERLPVHTDTLMVIDEDGRYQGRLAVADLLTGAPDERVGALMLETADSVRAHWDETEVAHLFERRDLISVPVLDSDDRLLGRITVDDVMDVLRAESDRTLLNSAGLNADEDLFAPILPSARRRGIWLGINLITVFAAAWVIGRFQDALDQLVALAVLMPVVASMGGIAGSQTLTLTIRGLALNQIVNANIRWLLGKELAVGLLNGLVWALVVALVAFLWFGNAGIALIIAIALILNLLAAALAGVGVPLLLDRAGIDPALSGAVILTTVTDVLGFLSFLGLASYFLLGG